MKDVFSATDAKREFGVVLLKAQNAPVAINKNGKRVAVVLSADTFAEYERMQRALLQRKIDKGIADVKAGRLSDGPETLAALKVTALDADL